MFFKKERLLPSKVFNMTEPNITQQYQERIKELNCLYGISEIIEKSGSTLADIFQETAELMRRSWQYPNITCTRIICAEHKYATGNFRESAWKQTANIIVKGETAGKIDVFYLEQKPAEDEGLFLIDERKLLNAIAERLGRVVERIQAEKALLDKNKHLANIINTSLDGIIVSNVQGEIMMANQSFCDNIGYGVEELACMHAKHIAPAEEGKYETVDGEKVVVTAPFFEESNERIFGTLLAGKNIYNWETWVKRKDGKLVAVEENVANLFDERGNRYGSTAIIRDITERKRSEEMQHLLLSAIEHAEETVIITDREGNVQYANPSFECISGYSVAELTQQNINILRSDKHDEVFYKKVWDTISQGYVWKGIITGKKKDGSLFSSATTISPIKNQQGKIVKFVNIMRDISNELKMEENLRQARKMESIGTLAGGIAHDFNNILAGILGYTELAQNDTGQDSPLQEYLVEILKSATRAKDLVRQILTFSRKNQVERKPVHLSKIVKEAAKLLRSTIPATIGIRQNIYDTTDMINADSTQIHQIVLNLCTNATHAMQKTGGLLEIALSPVVVTQDHLSKYHDISPGPFVELKISDTGTGIDPKVIHRVFDPFFTTKEKGSGTGMGLAMVHGIVKDHGGDIIVESQLSKGTTFTVILPQVVAEPEKKRGYTICNPKR